MLSSECEIIYYFEICMYIIIIYLVGKYFFGKKYSVQRGGGNMEYYVFGLFVVTAIVGIVLVLLFGSTKKGGSTSTKISTKS